MNKQTKVKSSPLHPRNKHQARYNLKTLTSVNPALKPFLKTNPKGELTIDFANNQAVVELNKALLIHFYKLSFWSLPNGFLCPPVPGRADYLHYLADLLMSTGTKRATFSDVRVLDIGCGANLIYPIIGSAEYDWQFTASDIEPAAIKNAQQIQAKNPSLRGLTIKHQANNASFFKGIIEPTDYFALTLCNPPFHASAEEAALGTVRKNQNLKKNNLGNASAKALNFGGQSNELWCHGGELGFIRGMMRESETFAQQVGWFSCLVSKKENLASLKKALKKLPITASKTVTMSQGQKVSRFIAWTFQS